MKRFISLIITFFSFSLAISICIALATLAFFYMTTNSYELAYKDCLTAFMISFSVCLIFNLPILTIILMMKGEL